MVSDEKVTINLIEYPFYVMNRFSLANFNILCLFYKFVCACVSVYMFMPVGMCVQFWRSEVNLRCCSPDGILIVKGRVMSSLS